MAWYKCGGGGTVLDFATMKAEYVVSVPKNSNTKIELPDGEYLAFLTTQSAYNVGDLINSKSSRSRVQYLVVNSNSVDGFGITTPSITWTSSGIKFTNTSATNANYYALVKVA